MGLLFVGGVMNLLWIAAITFFVLVEKVLPFGDRGGQLAGALMIIVGGTILVGLASGDTVRAARELWGVGG
jgi:predicted metal-binding membrane protein